MKKLSINLIITVIVMVTVWLTACQDSSLTPEQQITGKWHMKTAIGSYTFMGTNQKDTTHFTTADYFDFKEDGTLQISESSESYTGKWRIANNKLYISDTKYIDYASGFDMPVLTRNELQLYYAETSTTSSLEQKLNLYKL